MRVFHLSESLYRELPALPEHLPEAGFIWVGLSRQEFEQQLAMMQGTLLRWTGTPLLDLHVSDLLNPQLPSHFDYTSSYDLMVFRRLAASASALAAAPRPDDAPPTPAAVQQALQAIDTSPVGFAVFDRVLLTVHPSDCQVRDYFASRLGSQQDGRDLRGSSRLPSSPAELMLRMVNHMVDSYLELRRLLTRHLTALQRELLQQTGHFREWSVLLTARDTLNRLEDLCEDQRSAVQEWIDALGEWPAGDPHEERERELLRVRSRDVLEHVERVLSHVRRLESSAETAVQMHFSLTSERTNNIMRTLTVLTAIFLPLNLVTGIFGMNFDTLPLIHRDTGFWMAVGLMGALAVGLGALFWRKRYLSSRL